MPKLSPEQERAYSQLKEKINSLREKGLFPKGYAKTIAEKLNVSESIVYGVASGRSINHDIIDELLAMAKDNKMKRQLELADELLAD